MLRAFNELLQGFMHVLRSTFVEAHEVEIFSVEHGLSIISEVVITRRLLMRLLVHGAWCVIKLIIVLFLLQRRGELVRLKELAEIFPCLQLR